VADEADHRPDDALAQPTRSAIVQLLRELKRPARTDELAQRLRLHPNGIRLHLERLQTAGLVERLTVSGGRGRPRYEWALGADPAPGGEPPTAYRELARWLARSAAGSGLALSEVEKTGREIGREASPADASQSPPEALKTVLTAFGFQPARTDEPGARTRYTLRNCPYRDVVAENQPLVCVLHRGITHGLLERLAPGSQLAAFVPKDPYEAGCLIDVAWHERSGVLDAAPEPSRS
jgi:predicted ArsR family transcriptional regulator